MLGCFNPTLGQIWTNPNVGLEMQFLECMSERERERERAMQQ